MPAAENCWSPARTQRLMHSRAGPDGWVAHCSTGEIVGRIKRRYARRGGDRSRSSPETDEGCGRLGRTAGEGDSGVA